LDHDCGARERRSSSQWPFPEASYGLDPGVLGYILDCAVNAAVPFRRELPSVAT
jgi:hypothetical protein